MHLIDIPRLQAASPAQKIALIDEIWASIPAEAVPTPDAHWAELDRRMAALQQDAGKALTPEAARARIRNLTGL